MNVLAVVAVAVFISSIPIILLLLLFYVNKTKRFSKSLPFIGAVVSAGAIVPFIIITMAFAFMPDPLYVFETISGSSAPTTVIIAFSLVAAFLLGLAIFEFGALRKR